MPLVIGGVGKGGERVVEKVNVMGEATLRKTASPTSILGTLGLHPGAKGDLT